VLISTQDTAKLNDDGNKVGNECGAIPTNAKRAGGFVK
jgi:hypothetical protein